MTNTWKLALFFVLCLLVGLLINLPARQVLPHLQLPPNVKLVGVQGTVFSGTAREVILGQLPLRAVKYRAQPFCFLLLEACYQIRYEKGTVQLAYGILNGDIEISESRVEYTAVELVSYLPQLLVKPAGRLEMEIDNLAMTKGKTTALNGRLIWRDMGIDSDGSQVSIGDYQIDITGDQEKIEFKLSDLDASLDVTGKGDVRADGQYDVDIRIEAQTGLDPKIKNVLDLFAAKADYNKYRVEKKGRLPASLTRQLFK